MRFLMLAASLSQDSVNKKLINLAANLIRPSGNAVDLADFHEFEAPLYNVDVQNQEGFPTNITNFVQRMQQADALIIASPEYNFSIPGTLKNLIDWVSRMTPMPWKGQKILLLSASPSLVGGNRGLWATRIPLEACGAFVFPDMFSLASAYDSFNGEGHFKDVNMQNRLETTLKNFQQFVTQLK
jgi:chromate reductase, NAD(P)H dehydrogenase (quinone)